VRQKIVSSYSVLVVDNNPAFAAAISYFASEIESVAECFWARSIVLGIIDANRVQPDLILVDQTLIEAYALGLRRSVWIKTKAPKLVVMAGVDSLKTLSEARLACADAYVCREELPSLLPALIKWVGTPSRSKVPGRSRGPRATSASRTETMIAA
jgi:DNA-binding NarL/FixJ family response regulator